VREIERAYVNKVYRGHDAPKPLRVFLSGQKRGVHGQIGCELRRRSAIEAEEIIGMLREAEVALDRRFTTGTLWHKSKALKSLNSVHKIEDGILG